MFVNNLIIIFLAISNILFDSTYQHSIISTSINEISQLDRLGHHYDNIGDYDKAIETFRKLLTLSKKLNKSDYIAHALHDIGIIYDTKGEYKEALANYNQALELYKKNKNIRGEIESKISIGGVLRILSKFDSSYKTIQSSIKLADLYKEKDLLAKGYTQLGVFFYKFEENEKSIEAFLNSLKLCKEIKDIREESIVLGYLGIIYYKKNDLYKSLEYQQRSLIISQQIKDVAGIASSYNNIGDIFLARKEYDKAGLNYLNSLKIRLKINGKYGIAQTRNDLGELQLQLKNYNAAISYFTESNAYAIKESLLEMQKSNYLGLYTANENIGNYNEALKFLTLYTKLRDTILIEENNKKYSFLESKLEFDQKEKEFKNLQIAKAQKEFQNTILIISILLFLFIASAFILRYKTSKKNKELLEEKNEKIVEQKAILEQLNKTKDVFFSIIGHDLKNPFNALIGFSEILYNDFHNFSDEQKILFLNEIKKSAASSLLLLENLLNWSQTQKGTLRIDIRPTNLKNIIKSALENVSTNAKSKNIEIFCEHSGSTDLVTDENVVQTVIRNLVSNAVKFTPKDGTILISTKEVNGNINISVQDSGIGIDQDDINNIFSLGKNISSRGTENEQGTGLGLILCKEFLNKLDSTLEVESTRNVGTTFSFSLDKEGVTV